PVEPGILDLCEAALARFTDASFRTEPLRPDFDFEALWQAFVTLRQASSGCALKVHYDDPARRRLLKPEAVWEVENAMRLTAPQIRAASVMRTSWHRMLLSIFERFDLIAL
ncbi:MAG: amidase, partial [Mesorhizobium sp.]